MEKKIPDTALQSLSSKEIGSLLDRVNLSNQEQMRLQNALEEALQRELSYSKIASKGESQHRDIINQLIKNVKGYDEFNPRLKEDVSQLYKMSGKIDPEAMGFDYSDIQKMISSQVEPEADHKDDYQKLMSLKDRLSTPDKGFPSAPSEVTGTRTRAGMERARAAMEKAGADVADFSKGIDSMEAMANLGKEPSSTRMFDKNIDQDSIYKFLGNNMEETTTLPSAGENALERIAKQKAKGKILQKLASMAASPLSQAAMEFAIPSDLGREKRDIPAEEMAVEYPENIPDIADIRKKDEEQIKLNKIRQEVLKNILKPSL